MSSTNGGPSVTTTPNVVVQAVPAGSSSVPFDPSSVAITGGTIVGVLPSVATKLRSRIALAGRYPALMATPPTIGAATTSPTLTNLFTWNSGSISVKCANWIQDGGNARAYPVTVDYPGGGGATVFANSARFEWETSAPVCEIDGIFDGYRIFVDELDGKGWQKAGELLAVDSNRYYVPVSFSGAATPRKLRKYRVDCGGSSRLYGVRTSLVDVVYAPQDTMGLRAVLLGESFVEGTGATRGYWDGYGPRLGWLLGIDDFRVSGSGGTGLVQTNGARVAMPARVGSDVVAYSPDIAIIQCSQNDNPFTVAQCQSGLASCITAIKAAGITPVVIGVWNTTNATPATATARNTALAATAASFSVTYIDWITYITGTGKAGATTADGNADFMVAADGTHPTDLGHEYRADRLRHSFAAWANTL